MSRLQKKCIQTALANMVLILAMMPITPLQAAATFKEYQLSRHLYNFASKGDVGATRKMLEQGANPEIFILGGKGRVSRAEFDARKLGPNARTPLMYAAEHKNPEIVKLLLEYKANPDTKTSFGSTALMATARSGDLESARLLIQHKADINQKDKSGWSALMIAMGSGNVAVADLLKQAGARESEGDTRQAGFINAVRTADIPTVSGMLANGQSGATSDWFNYPAIFVAILHNQPQSVKTLLDAGANAEIEAPFGGVTPLMYAAGHGNLESIRHLLNAGASLKKSSKKNGDALHMAMFHKKYDAAKLLIEKGANPNSRFGANKQTSLMQMAFDGRTEGVKFLLEHGADARTLDRQKMTALQHATRQNNAEIVHMLVDAGAEPSAKHKGIDAFAMSVLNGRLETANALLKYKPDINAPIKAFKGRTLLMAVSARGDRDYKKVAFLLEKGADPNIQYKGKSALDYAREKKHHGKIEALFERFSR